RIRIRFILGPLSEEARRGVREDSWEEPSCSSRPPWLSEAEFQIPRVHEDDRRQYDDEYRRLPSGCLRRSVSADHAWNDSAQYGSRTDRIETRAPDYPRNAEQRTIHDLFRRQPRRFRTGGRNHLLRRIQHDVVSFFRRRHWLLRQFWADIEA